MCITQIKSNCFYLYGYNHIKKMPFKMKKGTCAGPDCQAQNVLIVYSKGSLCFHCNQKRLAMKRKPWKKSHKTTGEKDLFIEIWAERPHHCVNCKKNLGTEPRTFFFSHIKSKGAHPEKRLDKTNIQLLCLQCHQAYDHGTQQQFEKLGFKVKVTSVPAYDDAQQKDNPQHPAS
jgi:DNA-directed RNA polymerase subunit RPC12/RpoP